MSNIVYIIKSVGVSKGFKVVYNKQEQIGVYKEISPFRFELLDVLDADGNTVPLKQRVDFRSFNNTRLERGDIKNLEIISTAPSSYHVLVFDNFEDAVIAKLIMLRKVQEYFDRELEKLKEKMRKNLPKNYEERMDFLEKNIQ